MSLFDVGDWKHRRVLVWGLGRLGGGVGVARWLARRGANVTVMDRADPATLVESVRALSNLPITFHLGEENPSRLDQVDAVVVNPAVVKARSEFFSAINRAGIYWTTEINLFLERCPARIIGVTGSFGKSTTAAMIAAVLEAHVARNPLGHRVYLGGNIGHSLLADLEAMTPHDWVVLELSSAQLEDVSRVRFTPTLSVLTNLHPHHLDRHGTFSDYVQAKLHILGTTASAAPLVIADPRLAARLRSAEFPSPSTHGGEGDEAAILLASHVKRRRATVHLAQEPRPPLSLNVSGAHNLANAFTAWTAAALLGVPDSVTREALCRFRGLPHRLEFVAERAGVRFINDSKATAPQATLSALNAIKGPIIAIVGGAAIHEPLDACAKVLASRCRAIACVGETGRAIAAILRAGAPPGDGPQAHVVEEFPHTGLESAVRWAAGRARTGDTVLFSPGATSFDHYLNYEARGAHFVACVRALA